MTLAAKIHQGWRKTKSVLPAPIERAVTKLEFKTVKTVYTVFFSKRRKKMYDQVAHRTWKNEKDYQDYIETQIHKSDRHSLKWAGLTNGMPKRTTYFIGAMKKYVPAKTLKGTILCVGCRNNHELDYMEHECNVKTKGLDLFSDDKRIVVGDMQKMPFADNSFDGLYSCHSLEHAYDIKQAAKEFIRVVKPGGFIAVEVPVEFEKSPTDRWDVKNVAGLVKQFQPNVKKVLFSEKTGPKESKDARIIIEIYKKSARKGR